MLPKPPLGIYDQPHIGITLLELDQRREESKADAGPTPEELNVAILIRLGDVLHEVKEIRGDLTNVSLNLSALRVDVYHQSWAYRWIQLKAVCHRWWTRVKGAVNGS